MSKELTKQHHKKQSRYLPRDDHRDLTATDITAEGLNMEIERDDYREPNWTKPLMEMFTEWNTKGSRNYRGTAYRTEWRIKLPEAYQMTTEKAMDILPKLPTEMATEKSTKNAPRVYRKVDQQVYQVDHDATEAAYRECNHEVDRMVTEAVFERRLPSQCQFPMTTGCKIYSIVLAEAPHKAQTAQVGLNLVCITILQKLTC